MKYLKVLLLTLVLQVVVFAQVDTTSQHYYMFCYFLNSNDQGGLRLAFSSDGLNWQKYNNEMPVIVPDIGSEHRMRDPNILLDTSTGVFHLVYTTGWTSRDIGHATSSDLKNWSTQVAITLGDQIPNCKSLWAPEITYDELQHKVMCYWSTDQGLSGYRTWYSWTTDFKHYSTPTKFFDPGYSVIDATILKVAADKYYMFIKDERTSQDAGRIAKNIHYVFGHTPQGPWSAVSGAITNTGCEGPTAIKIGNDYRVYFDYYINFQSTYRMVTVANLDTAVDTMGHTWPQGAVLTCGASNFYYSHGSISEIPRAKVMQILYGVTDTTHYPQKYTDISASDIVVDPQPYIAPVFPLGKRNTGCGTGVGLAFIPPIFFKIASARRRKRDKRK